MRILKKLFFSIFLAGLAIFLLVIIYSSFINIYTTKDFGEAGLLVLSIIALFFILAIFKESLTELKEAKNTLKCANSNSVLIGRKEIADSLDQFQQIEDFQHHYSKADIEFLKSLLLPIKAKMITGLQNYKSKNHFPLSKYQYNYVDKCIQYSQENDVYWSLKNLKEFFSIGTSEQILCSDNELIAGVILISNIIYLCDARLSKIDEAEERQQSANGSELVKKAITDESALDLLQHELSLWHMCNTNFTLKEYFKLSDGESDFLQKTVRNAFHAIVESRKGGTNTQSSMRQPAEKTPCFFSALGAPSRLAQLNYKKKVKVKIHEKRENRA